MPDFSIIDAHVHLYDGGKVPYSWMASDWPALNFPHLMPEYEKASRPFQVERVIFCEVQADRGSNVLEVKFVQGLADEDKRIAAITGLAPLEIGAAVEEELLKLRRFPLLRGIRRGFDAGNAGMVLEANFLEGVRTLGRLGLHYEVGVPHSLLGFVVELARRVPDVSIVLNHIGLPDIAQQVWEPWHSHMLDLGKLHNVSVKVSGALAGAAPNAPLDQALSYLKHTIEAFGFDRCMFGSDWPSAERFASYQDWIELVDKAVAGATANEQRQLYRDTAIRVFRLADTDRERDQIARH